MQTTPSSSASALLLLACIALALFALPAGAANVCNDDAPCQNGGTCIDLGGGTFTCICTSRFTYVNCTWRNYCPDNTCQNNGTCNQTGPAIAYCSCQDGFYGVECEHLTIPNPPDGILTSLIVGCALAGGGGFLFFFVVVRLAEICCLSDGTGDSVNLLKTDDEVVTVDLNKSVAPPMSDLGDGSGSGQGGQSAGGSGGVTIDAGAPPATIAPADGAVQFADQPPAVIPSYQYE